MNNKAGQKAEKLENRAIGVLQLVALGILSLVVYKNFVAVPLLDVVFGISSLLLLIAILLVLGKEVTKQEGVVLFILLLFFWYAQLVSQKGALVFYVDVAYPLLGYSLALLLVHTRWNRHLVRLFCYVALAPFLYGFLIKGIRLTNGSNFYIMNRNTIPKLLVMSCAFLLMADHEREEGTYSLLIPFLTVLVCFFSRSRAGLLIAGALFFMVIVRTFISHSAGIRSLMGKHRWTFLLSLTAIALALGFGVLYAYSNSRLVAQGLSSNGRVQIYLAFLHELTLKRILIGYRPEILNGIGLHNSYLNLLAHFGLLSLLFFFIYTKALLGFLRNSFMFTGLLVLWGVYSLVESLSPFAVGDLLIIPLLMLSMQYGKDSNTVVG